MSGSTPLRLRLPGLGRLAHVDLDAGPLAEHRVDRLVQALAEEGEADYEQDDRKAGEQARSTRSPEAASDTARLTS